MTAFDHRIRTLALVATTVLVLFTASTASASSVGIYLDYALGPVENDLGVLPIPGSFDSYETGRISAGLAVDTAVAKDKLFNYRMNLGYEHVREKIGGSTFASYNGGSFENIFGFGVYRSKLMRVWLGPSVRLGVGVLDDQGLFGVPVPGTLINLTAGGGLAAGINVHTGNFGSAAFTIGYQYAYQGKFSTIVPSVLSGRDQRVNFNFAYFFRGKGDRFGE